MKSYPYKKVDAFTSDKSKGNPAAYLSLGKDELTYEEMLSIGKEHSGFVSEVVFYNNSGIDDIKLTYFSSECEVSFCGHGTIAAMYDIIRNDEKLICQREILINTNQKGSLKVYNHIKQEDAVFITAPQVEYLEIPVTVQEVEEVICTNHRRGIISQQLPLGFIDAGLRTLIVPILKFEDEVSIYADESKLKDFCLRNGIDIVLTFSMETNEPSFVAHTRVFAPKFGYLEDPATGSGNSAFGHYMLAYGLWDGGNTSIEQGGNNIAFNEVKLCTHDGDILFGGRATVRIDGKYLL